MFGTPISFVKLKASQKVLAFPGRIYLRTESVFWEWKNCLVWALRFFRQNFRLVYSFRFVFVCLIKVRQKNPGSTHITNPCTGLTVQFTEEFALCVLFIECVCFLHFDHEQLFFSIKEKPSPTRNLNSGLLKKWTECLLYHLSYFAILSFYGLIHLLQE